MICRPSSQAMDGSPGLELLPYSATRMGTQAYKCLHCPHTLSPASAWGTTDRKEESPQPGQFLLSLLFLFGNTNCQAGKAEEAQRGCSTVAAVLSQLCPPAFIVFVHSRQANLYPYFQISSGLRQQCCCLSSSFGFGGP